MKKTRLLVALLLIAALALSLAACSKKTPATVEQFQNEVKERGYEEVVIDLDTVDETTRATIDQVSAAMKLVDDNPSCSARFYVAKNENSAKNLFAGIKPLAENTAEGGVKTQAEVNLRNYNYYRVKGDSMICVLARIDNTLLYLQADNALEDEVDDIVKTLGYK